MATSPVSPHGRPTSFIYSNMALAVTAAGVGLTVTPIARADASFAGFVLLWIGLFLFMRQSGPNLRYWATLMVAVVIWVSLATISGTLARVGAASGTHASEATPAQTRTEGVDLRAEVRFTGAQFVVANRGNKPWREIVLSLHAEKSPDVYKVQLERLAAGRSATVQLSRFATSDGHTFSTDLGGPRSFVIDASTGDTGEHGTYEARWD